MYLYPDDIFLRPSGTFFVGGYMIYPRLKPRAEFYRPYGTYPVLLFPVSNQVSGSFYGLYMKIMG